MAQATQESEFICQGCTLDESSGKAAYLFQLSANGIFTRRVIPTDVEHIRLAANLAVFDITLARAGSGVNLGFIPFTAAGTLES